MLERRVYTPQENTAKPESRRVPHPPFKGPHTIETRLRMSLAHRGKKESGLTILKISEAMTKRWRDDEEFAARMRQPHSQEHKDGISDSIAKKWEKDKKYARKIKEGLRGNKNFEGHHHTERTKRKIRKAIRKLLKDSRYLQHREEGWLKRAEANGHGERQMWKETKRKGVLAKIVENDMLTEDEVAILTIHFETKRKIEVPDNLIDKFTIAVANLS